MSLFGAGRRGEGGRSSADRERDRLERARKRAEREGLPLEPEDGAPPGAPVEADPVGPAFSAEDAVPGEAADVAAPWEQADVPEDAPEAAPRSEAVPPAPPAPAEEPAPPARAPEEPSPAQPAASAEEASPVAPPPAGELSAAHAAEPSPAQPFAAAKDLSPAPPAPRADEPSRTNPLGGDPFAADEELEWDDPRLRDVTPAAGTPPTEVHRAAEPLAAGTPPTEIHRVPDPAPELQLPGPEAYPPPTPLRSRPPEVPPEPPSREIAAGGGAPPPPPREPLVAVAGGGDGGEERPAALRRVGAPSVGDLPQIAGLPQRTPPRRRRWGLRILLLALLALLVVVGYGLVRTFEPFGSDPQGSVRLTIPDGASASDIGDLLAERGVVDSSFFFNLRARISGQRGDLKAGTFTLQRDMTYADALEELTKNPEPTPVVRVTLPEGPSITEAASTVREAGIDGSYLKAAARRPTTTKGLRTYDVPSSVKTLEGFLFPATYELKRGATAGQLVRDQIDAFRGAFDNVNLTRARRKNLSAYDVVIIASMIEREAGVAKDRRLISAVIYNRLSEGMPLGIDATIRYREDNWTRPLKVSELERDGAYNTRLRTGLPPTPIGNPGLASLKAAANPADVSYLYYVVKPCGNGAHAFSSTDAGFQDDVDAYNKKREELGGKDPSRC